MAIRKIDKAEIDFSKIYGTSYDAMQQDNNTINVNENLWGDTDELEFDDETGLVSESGVGLGFINQNDLISIDKVDNTENVYSPGNPVSPTVDNPESNDLSIGKTNENGNEEIEGVTVRDENGNDIASEMSFKKNENIETNNSTETLYDEETPIIPIDNDGEDVTHDESNRVDLPSNVSQTGIIKNYTNYDYFEGKWNKGTDQETLSKIWTDAGETSDRGIATLNGRYLVAVSPKFGNVGDKIDVCLDDGTIIKCTIADAKGPDAKSEWGHKFGKAVDVIEWESMGGQDTIDISGWEGHNVESITNKGTIL